jgi:glyoxylase-like metal-dependent hydrolase (beta-lactamase superfamily II)
LPLADLPGPEEWAPGIWRVVLPMNNGFMSAVNVYLAEDDHGVTLIDCGLPNDDSWEALNGALDTLHIPMRHLSRILLTHAHPDHSGMAGRIAEESGATVWIHQRDLEYLERRFLHTEEYQRNARAWLLAQGVPEDEAAELSQSVVGTIPQTQWLPDGETYRAGQRIHLGPFDFEVQWTPGHTPGHVCFADEAHQLLICGDHVLPNVSPNVGMQPDSDVNPIPGYLASLETLSESDVRTTLPGHGERFEVQARARTLLSHQLARQRHLQDLVAEHGPCTAYELGAIVWTSARSQSWSTFRPITRRNALNTLSAHLELLRAEGRLTRSDEIPYRYEASS